MLLAAISLIVLLALALLTSIAVIVHELAAEQRSCITDDEVRVPLAA